MMHASVGISILRHLVVMECLIGFCLFLDMDRGSDALGGEEWGLA